MIECPICSFPLRSSDVGGTVYKLHCYRCGIFQISLEAKEELLQIELSSTQSSHISSWLNDNPSTMIHLRDIPYLISLVTPALDEKAEKLLLFLSKLFPYPGQIIPDFLKNIHLLCDNKENLLYLNKIGLTKEKARSYLEIFAHSWATSPNEFAYILYRYLVGYKKVFDKNLPGSFTPEGWAYINSLKQRNPESNIVFLAMKFCDEVKQFNEEWVETAIIETDYEPIRIDKYPHNNLIDDEIISKIKRSRFIVADFSFNNNGVYYEAGFARGLNIPVISICEKQLFESKEYKTHFDTNHYSFILYDKQNGAELKNTLRLRIEATIGRGKSKRFDKIP